MTELTVLGTDERNEQKEPGVLRVLVVEDDEAQARAMVRWFETTGEFEVALAHTGTEARRCLDTDARWDVVVSDIDLPGTNGLELLALFKQRQPDTPVLMVTAHRNFDYVVTAIRNQADDFMLKPLGKTALVSRTKALIASARAGATATRDRVLAIGAGPDVVEVSCGGILLSHVARGDEVTILTLSGAASWGPRLERLRQSEEAATSIGAQLRPASLPDGNIPEGDETVSVIRAAKRRLDPTIVYTHSKHDRDRDHRAAHDATVVACGGVPNVYCYQSPTATVEFCPSVFVNVSAHLDRKVEVLGSYRTEHERRPYLKPEHVRAAARYWGRFSDYEAAEPLELLRQSEVA